MKLIRFASCALILGLCGTGLAQSQPGKIEYLTGPSDSGPRQVVMDYIRANLSSLGLTAEDVADPIIEEVHSPQTGSTHLYLTQTHRGIAVETAILNATVTREGRLLTLKSRFVADLAEAVQTPDDSVSSELAIIKSAEHLGLEAPEELQLQSSEVGPAERRTFSGATLSRSDITVHLRYLPTADRGVPLIWVVELDEIRKDDWWRLYVNASNGEVLGKFNYTIHDSFHAPYREPGKKIVGYKASRATGQHLVELFAKFGGVDGSSYNVLPLPAESPNHGDFTTINDPAHPDASPFGWHDTDGVAGAEFTTTEGNNVHAYQDRDGNDTPPTPNDDPDGGPSLTFDVTYPLDSPPIDYLAGATVNLFFWNNLSHDILHFFGFDEAGGNFQETNYSGQGTGSDSVNAQSQSRADLEPTDQTRNNANFSTPAEGLNPRMRMYEFTGPAGVEVLAPVDLVGTSVASLASFGDQLENDLTGNVEVVDDGDVGDGTGSTTDACQALINGATITGNIALLDRGSCSFVDKVRNAQNAGAIGVIIVNNQGDGLVNPGGDNAEDINIPSLFVGQTFGTSLKEAILGGEDVQVTFKAALFFNRDSDLDPGIIVHEYGHGLSNRLTGGPSQVFCLNTQTTPEQAGEGWSDFLTLYFTQQPDFPRGLPRGIGTYSSFQEVDGPGIRPFRYANDMTVNPATYTTISEVSVPHGVGFVFCTTLWDMYWNLVDDYGYDADLYQGTGGNNLALRLVNEGLKRQPCSPGFIDARDAILAADLELNAGANACAIWRAFARRGMGVNADQGSSASVTDSVEDFSVPAECNCAGSFPTVDPTSEGGSFCEGESVTLSVDGGGYNLQFQWQKDGENIEGAVLPVLQIDSLVNGDAGSYTCIVSHECESTTSAAMVVEVAPPIQLGNEAYSNWLTEICAGQDSNNNGILDVIDYVALINAASPAKVAAK
ncbi:M36 family metallopeptidase [Sulfidibacter corallicola]|uniref:M36 family metallopeptidase n=1 Tax=Sulfidibacter corallicola TaxID=2818388 RepID=A0A8A4TCU0_SULCO|nr:M36 family metallopeptidase [Sulfidibacter corallicola]QTD47919.1 M36 family metallopeptidase [Sulfidibacter corallicola]